MVNSGKTYSIFGYRRVCDYAPQDKQLSLIRQSVAIMSLNEKPLMPPFTRSLGMTDARETVMIAAIATRIVFFVVVGPKHGRKANTRSSKATYFDESFQSDSDPVLPLLLSVARVILCDRNNPRGRWGLQPSNCHVGQLERTR
jgi:hypothetical protein